MMDDLDQQLHELSRFSRLKWITDTILHQGAVTVEDLCEQLNVSRMTIHRDLDELERQGILRKVRGGATAQRSALFESDIRYRSRSEMREKEAIARLDLKYVEPGQAIMMDDSTTTVALAHLLKDIKPLTLITNCMGIMNEMIGVEDLRLIALGGEYIPHYNAFGGIICERSVEVVRANVLFMSTSAINGELAFHQEENVVKVKQAMLASATKRILMLDHTKVGKVALHLLAPLKEFDIIIFDEGVDREYVHTLQNAGIQVEIAPYQNSQSGV